jgi:hypothetical protein
LKTTLVITVDKEMEAFIYEQPGTVDPSNFINHLFHEEIKRQGFTINKELKNNMDNNQINQETELFLDKDTVAAG